MEKRYRVLRFISGLYKVIAVLAFLLAIVGGIAAAFVFSNPFTVINPSSGVTTTYAVQSPVLASIVAFFGAFLGGAIIALSLYAFSNLIDLLLATEENTRATALLLNRLNRRRRQQAPAPRVPAASPGSD